jgi:hypothetical protein
VHINITDIRTSKTTAGWPKCNFKVTFGDEVDGSFQPKFTSEGWSLYVKHCLPDSRGIKGTRVLLPRVPLLGRASIPGKKLFFIGTWITPCACEEGLLDAIHTFMSTHPKVRRWMNLEKGEGNKETKIKDPKEVIKG